MTLRSNLKIPPITLEYLWLLSLQTRQSWMASVWSTSRCWIPRPLMLDRLFLEAPSFSLFTLNTLNQTLILFQWPCSSVKMHYNQPTLVISWLTSVKIHSTLLPNRWLLCQTITVYPSLVWHLVVFQMSLLTSISIFQIHRLWSGVLIVLTRKLAHMLLALAPLNPPICKWVSMELNSHTMELHCQVRPLLSLIYQSMATQLVVKCTQRRFASVPPALILWSTQAIQCLVIAGC